MQWQTGVKHQCSITAELLKSGGAPIISWLLLLFTLIWKHSSMFIDWNIAIILPLWKGKGSKSDCTKYWIGLTDYTGTPESELVRYRRFFITDPSTKGLNVCKVYIHLLSFYYITLNTNTLYMPCHVLLCYFSHANVHLHCCCVSVFQEVIPIAQIKISFLSRSLSLKPRAVALQCQCWRFTARLVKKSPARLLTASEDRRLPTSHLL